jgi:hypothetical protein
MTLHPVVHGTDQSGKAATNILRELQGLKVAVATGAAADTDITVAGLKYTAAQIAAGTADTIIAILEQDGTSGVLAAGVDYVAEAQAGSVASRIQLATTATTGKVLVIFYFTKPV